NERYLSGYAMFGLPIEEWLFFVCIPYACIFTHYALTTLFPNFRVSEKTAVALHVLLVSLLVVTLWYNYDRWYTLVNFCCAVLVMAVVYNYKKEWLQPFWATYAVLLVPFFIVNGVLTGTGIAEQVVWYNNNENLGIRLLTVPIEDMIYNLGMLLTVYAVMERLHERDTAKG
ncbi:MAG: lycopene cyclase domain-containing protein, partial [Marinirhabdus sp.]